MRGVLFGALKNMDWSLVSHGRIYDSGDPLVVYFDPASGKTCLLNAVAAFLLEQLKAGPRSTSALSALLKENMEHPDDTDFEGATEKLLRELESFDLVETV
jgi:PqqD family protein of HPr-rel-A system